MKMRPFGKATNEDLSYIFLLVLRTGKSLGLGWSPLSSGQQTYARFLAVFALGLQRRSVTIVSLRDTCISHIPLVHARLKYSEISSIGVRQLQSSSNRPCNIHTYLKALPFVLIA